MKDNDYPKFNTCRSLDNNRIVTVSKNDTMLIQCINKNNNDMPIALNLNIAIQLRDFLNEFIEANNG